MIVEYIRYNVAIDRQTEFENAYRKAGMELSSSPYCISYELSHCVEKQENYVLRIEWDSLDGHVKGFRKSAEFRSFFNDVQPFLSNIEEMNHYELIAIKGQKSTQNNSMN